MLILDRLLIGGIRFVLDKVAAAVDQEMNDEGRLREELLAAQMRYELGEMSEQDFAEFNGGTRLAREAFHLQDGALLDSILFAARGDDRVHREISKKPFGTKALKPCAIPKGRAFYGSVKGRSKPK